MRASNVTSTVTVAPSRVCRIGASVSVTRLARCRYQSCRKSITARMEKDGRKEDGGESPPPKRDGRPVRTTNRLAQQQGSA